MPDQNTLEQAHPSQPDAAEAVESMDPALRRQVEARQAARRAASGEGEAERGERSGPALIDAAARGEKLSDEEIHDALSVYMQRQDDPDHKVEPKPLKLNVGSDEEKIWVRWVIAPVDDAVISQIRKEATKGSKSQKLRGEGQVDELEVGRQIVATGTIEPDLDALKAQMRVTKRGDAVHNYFRKFGKTGLIVQLSGKILGLSGYDEDDVADLEKVGG